MTAVGATSILLALSGVVAFVWITPENPVRDAITHASAPTAAEKILKQRNELLSRVVELSGKIDALSDDLASSQTDRADLQQQLWTIQGQLDALPVGGSAPSKKARTTPVGPITAPSKAELVAPASPYFGMYTEQAPFNWATFDATSAKIGSAPNAVGYFGGWDENFRANAVTGAWKHGNFPVLTWESRPIDAANDQVNEPAYSLPAIIGDAANGIPGSYDDYLHQYARDIIATGLPLGIRLDHEMNGDWYPWSETNRAGGSVNGNRVGDYVAMWRHVHDIFEEEGANSLVVWIWSPNITNNLPATHKAAGYLEGLYPGDAYVDWVGLSGYLRPPYADDNTFSFDYTFGASLAQLRTITDKPIFLAEIGASETGGHKAAWVTSLFEGLARPENADIVGVAWFNLAVTSYTEGVRATNDWRIDSRDDSLAAFSAGLRAPGSRFALAPY